MSDWSGFSDGEWVAIWRIVGAHLIAPEEEEPRARAELVSAVTAAVMHGAEARKFWRGHIAKEKLAVKRGEAVDHSGRIGRRGPKKREDFEFLFGAVSQVFMDYGVSPHVKTKRGWTNNPKVVAGCVAVLDSLRGKRLLDPVPSPYNANQLVRKWLSEWTKGPAGDRRAKAGMYRDDLQGN